MKKLILGFAFLLVAIPCGARIITVDDDGPADFKIIQAAIDDSNNGDTIVVYPGTYYETFNFDINPFKFKGKNIVLTSTDPNDPAVVEHTVIEGGYYSVISIVDANVTIDGFTIQNGSGYRNGGICCTSSKGTAFTVKISNNIIQNNTVEWVCGAGIYCDSYVKPVIVGNIIQNNRIEGWGIYTAGGAGIYCASLDCEVSGNVVVDNQINSWYGQGYFDYADGGGIWVGGGLISDNTVSRNSVGAWAH